MRLVERNITLSATDLASFLGCRHRTGLDLAVALGALPKPHWNDPMVQALRARGEEHERRFVESLRNQGLKILELRDADDAPSRTLEALESGVDVVVQAELRSDGWHGYADILRRVERPSALGGWSYEVYDTKLARDTRGGTILQLCVYSDLLAAIQGLTPQHFHVVTPPDQTVHTYRVEDYAAYYRLMRQKLIDTLALGSEVICERHYPDPVEPCEICRWWQRCDARRRQDDHPAFVAGMSRVHRTELAVHGYDTLEKTARMPLPLAFKPSRGAKETYEKLREQARLQAEQRAACEPRFELLPVRLPSPDDAEGPVGLCRLPEPSPRDLFLDLEGARFAREGGREYLFGIVAVGGDGGASAFAEASADETRRRQGYDGQEAPPLHGSYRSWWAFDDSQERGAFEAVVDLIMEAWRADPGMHVYHFAHYEPSAFKRLSGRHATRAEELDRLLRAERFVDLHIVTRQAVRAGVESYSIKQLEQYYAFTRDVALGDAGAQLHAIEVALEANAPDLIDDAVRAAVLGYNRDDCRSTLALRNWLELLRTQAEKDGTAIPRPEAKTGEAPDRVAGLQQEAQAIRARLLADLTPAASDPAHPDHVRWLLAYLVDWHRREDKAQWWEYYRLRELPEDELLDEAKAIAGLEFVERLGFKIGEKGKPTKSVIDRYRYPGQDMEIGNDAKLKLQDGRSFGKVVARDLAGRTIDIEKGPSRTEFHPTAVFAADVVPADVVQRAVMRLGLQAADHKADAQDLRRAEIDLLFRHTPRLRGAPFDSAESRVARGSEPARSVRPTALTGEPFAARSGESPVDFAVRIVATFDRTTLAIQGPPGAGKTYAGARMIRELVKAGKRVGVTAVSHKVIRNLLDELHGQSNAHGERVRIGHKLTDGDPHVVHLTELEQNEPAIAAIHAREVDVLGGTAWFWSREDAHQLVDVLFVDEAGQMSLANVLAVSQAARSVVLLGDPQQLEQPRKGCHPDGVSLSSLEYVMGGAKTMPPERGIFMPETWRLAPAVCAFTSEMFYEGQLRSKAGLENQRLVGCGAFDGAGIYWVPVQHDRNRNWSEEEVDVVTTLTQRLLEPHARWIDEHGTDRPLTPSDLRIVAPYNAQVNRLSERLGARGVPVGTVDKFQGQTAAVVIYSMATSRPEDAPRGMEFLYSLNRLNVATSRARCAVILVASPRLFEPECRTPEQMQLANALCRYREIAREVRL